MSGLSCYPQLVSDLALHSCRYCASQVAQLDNAWGISSFVVVVAGGRYRRGIVTLSLLLLFSITTLSDQSHAERGEVLGFREGRESLVGDSDSTARLDFVVVGWCDDAVREGAASAITLATKTIESMSKADSVSTEVVDNHLTVFPGGGGGLRFVRASRRRRSMRRSGCSRLSGKGSFRSRFTGPHLQIFGSTLLFNERNSMLPGSRPRSPVEGCRRLQPRGLSAVERTRPVVRSWRRTHGLRQNGGSNLHFRRGASPIAQVTSVDQCCSSKKYDPVLPCRSGFWRRFLGVL